MPHRFMALLFALASMAFALNAVFTEGTEPTIDKIYIGPTGGYYSVLTHGDMDDMWEVGGSLSCHTDYMSLPSGWALASSGNDTKNAISAAPWQTSHVVLGDGDAFTQHDVVVPSATSQLEVASRHFYRCAGCQCRILIQKEARDGEIPDRPVSHGDQIKHFVTHGGQRWAALGDTEAVISGARDCPPVKGCSARIPTGWSVASAESLESWKFIHNHHRLRFAEVMLSGTLEEVGERRSASVVEGLYVTPPDTVVLITQGAEVEDMDLYSPYTLPDDDYVLGDGSFEFQTLSVSIGSDGMEACSLAGEIPEGWNIHYKDPASSTLAEVAAPTVCYCDDTTGFKCVFTADGSENPEITVHSFEDGDSTWYSVSSCPAEILISRASDSMVEEGDGNEDGVEEDNLASASDSSSEGAIGETGSAVAAGVAAVVVLSLIFRVLSRRKNREAAAEAENPKSGPSRKSSAFNVKVRNNDNSYRMGAGVFSDTSREEDYSELEDDEGFVLAVAASSPHALPQKVPRSPPNLRSNAANISNPDSCSFIGIPVISVLEHGGDSDTASLPSNAYDLEEDGSQWLGSDCQVLSRDWTDESKILSDEHKMLSSSVSKHFGSFTDELVDPQVPPDEPSDDEGLQRKSDADVTLEMEAIVGFLEDVGAFSEPAVARSPELKTRKRRMTDSVLTFPFAATPTSSSSPNRFFTPRSSHGLLTQSARRVSLPQQSGAAAIAAGMKPLRSSVTGFSLQGGKPPTAPITSTTMSPMRPVAWDSPYYIPKNHHPGASAPSSPRGGRNQRRIPRVGSFQYNMRAPPSAGNGLTRSSVRFHKVHAATVDNSSVRTSSDPSQRRSYGTASPSTSPRRSRRTASPVSGSFWG